MQKFTIQNAEQQVLLIDKIVKTAPAMPAKYLRMFRKKTIRETVAKVHERIRADIQYKPRSNGREIYIQSIERLIECKEGNAVDFVLIAAAILTQLKIPFFYCLVKFNGRTFHSHAFLMVPDGANAIGFYSLDASVPECFMEAKGITYRSFIKPE